MAALLVKVVLFRVITVQFLFYGLHVNFGFLPFPYKQFLSYSRLTTALWNTLALAHFYKFFPYSYNVKNIPENGFVYPYFWL